MGWFRISRFFSWDTDEFREWDGWMASLTAWTWTWANSRKWWGTGKSGVLQSMGVTKSWTWLGDWTTTTTTTKPKPSETWVSYLGLNEKMRGDGGFCLEYCWCCFNVLISGYIRNSILFSLKPCMCVLSHFSRVWLFVTLWTMTNMSGSSVHRILQAESGVVAISFSRGFS